MLEICISPGSALHKIMPIQNKRIVNRIILVAFNLILKKNKIELKRKSMFDLVIRIRIKIINALLSVQTFRISNQD